MKRNNLFAYTSSHKTEWGATMYTKCVLLRGIGNHEEKELIDTIYITVEPDEDKYYIELSNLNGGEDNYTSLCERYSSAMLIGDPVLIKNDEDVVKETQKSEWRSSEIIVG